MNMKKRGKVLLCMAIFIVGTQVSLAHEEESAEDPTLTFAFDQTYSSKYMWRGYDVFGENSAYMPSVDIDLFQTGWSLNVWAAVPMGSGSESLSELDYTFAYNTTFFEDEAHQADVTANWIYYDFYKANNTTTPDAVEFGVGMEFPNLLGDSGLTPSVYGATLDSAEDNVGGEVDGNYYTFALSYDFSCPQTEQEFNITADVHYNDGLFAADHDWSHSTYTLSTSYDVNGVSVSPFLSYQCTMEDSSTSGVNPDSSELWGGVSMSF